MSESGYGAGGMGGAFNTNTSYQSMQPRHEKVRATIERGKRYVQAQAILKQREEKAMFRQASKDKKGGGKRFIDEDAKLEMEVREAYNDRQAKL